MSKLSKTKIAKLTKPGLHADGDTLFLNIAKGGTRSWIQRLTVGGKRRDLGLGPYPLVTLEQARDAAIDNRRMVRAGHDPLKAKRDSARLSMTPTFEEAALATWATITPRLKSEKGRRLWWSQLAMHALPALGKIRVDHVSREDVLRTLAPIWLNTPATARKVRSNMQSVFGWCMAKGYTDSNVVELVSAALSAQGQPTAHRKALDYADVAEALEKVKTSSSSLSVKLALRFLVYTAARSGEVREADWSEIDIDAATWTIPGSRMKGGIAHKVPLSEPALAVVREAMVLRVEGDEGALLFPSPQRPGKALWDQALSGPLKDLGVGCVPHGFRTSFRTWASEATDTDHAVAELCLAHKVGSDVERAYNRTTLFDKRRALMDRWAKYLTGVSAKVVSIRA